MILDEIKSYCQQIVSGKILASRWVKLACKRTLDDLKKAESADFPYWFDEKEADRIIDFSQACKQYEGDWKGQYLKLQPWQKHILASVFGWKRKSDNHRRFRKAYIQVGRKSGKTTMISTVLLYDLLMTPGSQIYCVCTKRETAKIAFNHCKESIRQNPGLSARLRIYNSTYRIVNERNAGFIEALAYAPDRMDGLNPSMVCIDEVASMDTYEVVKRMQSGMGARPDGLLFEISSASDNLQSVGHNEYEQSKTILEGMNRSDEAESVFCIMYCLDEEDSWTDEKLYIKANPGIGITVSEDFLHKQKLEAMRNPAFEGEFRTRNLGQFITPITSWIPANIWRKSVENAKTHKLDMDKPFYAVGACDLSKRVDLTAFTVCVYQDGFYYLFHKVYFPEQTFEEKVHQDNELWLDWMNRKIVTKTYGRTVDYNLMFSDIREAIEKWNMSELLIDPYNSQTLINELEGDLDVVEVTQNIKNISPMAKATEELIYNGKIVDDNPCSTWCFNNAEIYTDNNQNIKVQKKDNNKNSTKRIDLVITSLMAVGYLKSKLDEGDIDLRNVEEIQKETHEFLKDLQI